MPEPRRVTLVYIVADNVSVREGLTGLMNAEGLEVRPCRSVMEFLQMARSLRECCVLLDLEIVLDCSRSLRETLQYIARVLPFVALSSIDGPAPRRLARELGAKSFFHRPVDSRALLDVIEWVTQRDGQGS